MATVSQAQRLIRISTPIGEDVLVPTAFSGQEQISNLFSYQIEAVSVDDAIAPGDLVGKRVTVSLERLDDEPRFFDGFVSRFTNFGKSHDLTRYHVEVIPWLWFLTRTANCRIFQNKSIPDIIQQLFKDLGMTDFKLDLKGTFSPIEYCVQYRETAFNFVSRLMEREGIFYFFQHEEGKHTMVLANHKQAYSDCPEQQIEFQRVETGDLQRSRIYKWQHDYEFRPGKWAQTDYNFQTPSNSLLTNTETVVQLTGNAKFEVFDYPGDYGDTSDGQNYTDIRMEEDEVPHNAASGTSSCKTLTPGHWFELTGHEIAAEDGQYVITSIHHWANNAADASDRAGGSEEYGNSFTCIPRSVSYRPPRITRRPMVRGPQVAIVTGPAGEEIYTDKFGRVKVHFPWDRESKKDENSSCWIRVSQIHAGKGFGGIDIPRIGDEVVVTFYEGDPDRPVISGRLYHAENMPPFGLPGGMNVSGMKSNSTKGGGGYNELVLDDTKGNELIRLHGQFDMDSTIKHDLREHVLNNRSRDVTVNETIQVGADRSETVGGNESLSVAKNRKEDVGVDETLSVGSNRIRTVGGNETVTVALLRTHNVGINEAITVGAAQEVTVGGIRAVTVGISQTTTVGTSQTTTIGTTQTTSIGSNLTETIGGKSSQSTASDRSVKVGGKRSVSIAKDDGLSVGAKLSIDAKDEISIKTGSASLIMKKDGTIQLKGKDITVTGSGQITVKADKDVVIKGKNILEN